MIADNKINDLIMRIAKLCRGENTGVAMGALMNMVMTVAQNHPDAAMQRAIALSFRNIADQLEQQTDGVKQ